MVETTLCYIFRHEEVLMLYRNKKKNDFHEGKWNGLGGKVEVGESALQGVKREVLEESGLSIENPKLQGVCYFPSFDGEVELMYLYCATEFTGELIDCNEGDLSWIKKQDLLSLNIWESDQIFLPYVLANKIFTGVFLFEGKDLKAYEVNEVTETELYQFAFEKGSLGLSNV